MKKYIEKQRDKNDNEREKVKEKEGNKGLQSVRENEKRKTYRY